MVTLAPSCLGAGALGHIRPPSGGSLEARPRCWPVPWPTGTDQVSPVRPQL